MFIFNKRKRRDALLDSVLADVEILLEHCDVTANHISCDIICAIVKRRLDESIDLLGDIRKLLKSS